MNYTYSKYPVDIDKLSDEILSAMGLFITKLYSGDYVDGSVTYIGAEVDGNLNLEFTDSLTVDQVTVLDTIVSNHVVDPMYTPFDWAVRRDVYSPYFYALAGAQLQNWGTLTYSIKLLACKFFYAPYNLRVTIVTDTDDAINWDSLLSRTKRSREACVEAMRKKVGQYMRLGSITLAQTQDFYVCVYEFVIWFEQANKPDFKQWLTNEVGSPYENDGFAQRAYYTVQMKDDIMSIYNGNY